MSISRKGLSLFLCLAVLLSLVPLVTFSANPIVPATVVNASGWAGWDSMDTIAVLPASDVYLDTAAQELKTHLDAMSGRSWTIAQSDVAGPAIRLDVNQTAPEFADLNEEAVRLFRYKSPEEAVNRKIVYRGREMTVIGVLDNYHQMSLKSLPVPLIYLLD